MRASRTQLTGFKPPWWNSTPKPFCMCLLPNNGIKYFSIVLDAGPYLCMVLLDHPCDFDDE